jgi:DNA-binding transcriptional LysR family regulator
VNINLKLLYTFLQVAEHASFRQAADNSHRSVPAISMQIKQLEAQLGLTLFRRTTRRVELTSEGARLLVSVRRALAEIDEGLQQLRDVVDIQHMSLSISCIPTVAGTLLPEILEQFSKEYPSVTIYVQELGVPELQESVRKREVDFGIGPKTARMTGLSFHSVFDDEYYALVDQAYQPQRKRGITLKELGTLQIVRLGAGSAFRDDVDGAARKSGVELKSHYAVMQVSTMVALAERGLGVAVLPRIAIPRVTLLKALRIIEPVLRREIGIVSAKGYALSAVASRFAELIEHVLAQEGRR